MKKSDGRAVGTNRLYDRKGIEKNTKIEKSPTSETISVETFPWGRLVFILACILLPAWLTWLVWQNFKPTAEELEIYELKQKVAAKEQAEELEKERKKLEDKLKGKSSGGGPKPATKPPELSVGQVRARLTKLQMEATSNGWWPLNDSVTHVTANEWGLYLLPFNAGNMMGGFDISNTRCSPSPSHLLWSNNRLLKGNALTTKTNAIFMSYRPMSDTRELDIFFKPRNLFPETKDDGFFARTFSKKDKDDEPDAVELEEFVSFETIVDSSKLPVSIEIGELPGQIRVPGTTRAGKVDYTLFVGSYPKIRSWTDRQVDVELPGKDIWVHFDRSSEVPMSILENRALLKPIATEVTIEKDGVVSPPFTDTGGGITVPASQIRNTVHKSGNAEVRVKVSSPCTLHFVLRVRNLKP